MTDYLEIGCTPASEDCEQLGPGYDPQRAIAECRAFRNQIRRELGPEPEGASLVIRSNPHDFGTYHEVACKFVVGNEEAKEYAFACESTSCEYWDDAAKQELGLVAR